MSVMTPVISRQASINPYPFQPTWERQNMIEDRVRIRRERAVAAFRAIGLPYAVIGGHAVGNWVSRVDESLVRSTRDVDVMIRRDGLNALISAMVSYGWFHTQTSGVDLFLDGENDKPSEGIHLLFANEKVRPNDPMPIPPIDDAEETEQFRVVSLEGLVRMKLIAFRRKDQVHLLDLIGVKLIDDTWPSKYPPPLDERLKELLADPEG